MNVKNQKGHKFLTYGPLYQQNLGRLDLAKVAGPGMTPAPPPPF
ncbi:MAG TPA: hypothetical protein VGB27_03605 [Candidatus Binatia bacterium]|jgi:hypothetical protein